LTQMTTQLRQWDIETAQATLESLQLQQAAADARQEYFDRLISEDLSPLERTQQVARHTVSGIHTAGSLLALLAGISKLIPPIGSPFAMKYGGIEIGGSAKAFGQKAAMLADASEAIGASAGLEASFDRRRRDWSFSSKNAKHDH